MVFICEILVDLYGGFSQKPLFQLKFSCYKSCLATSRVLRANYPKIFLPWADRNPIGETYVLQFSKTPVNFPDKGVRTWLLEHPTSNLMIIAGQNYFNKVIVLKKFC